MIRYLGSVMALAVLSVAVQDQCEFGTRLFARLQTCS
jgi:hypothetical protein